LPDIWKIAGMLIGAVGTFPESVFRGWPGTFVVAV
jgi:hypothetical protein